MNEKFKEFSKQLLSAVSPGGVEQSVFGTRIDVSANGTTTVPSKDLKDILFRRYQEMNQPASPSPAQSLPRTAAAK